MAKTPTPGILIKLLQCMTDAASPKPTGEHRSALLQVISIVPALSGTEDHLCPNKGFYIKVSDTVYCTYVSLSSADNDLILADRLQLGQFVYIDRLEQSHPVPQARTLRPLPGRQQCLGNPEEILLRHNGLIIQTPNPSGFNMNPNSITDPSPNPNPFIITSTNYPSDKIASTNYPTETKQNYQLHPISTNILHPEPEESSLNLDNPSMGETKRPVKAREPSPRNAKLRDSSPRNGKGRSASPMPGNGKGRSASPVPSKCVVPSLARAQEENRPPPQRDGCYVVPSRYRQPSPTGSNSRKVLVQSSPGGRRASLSPGKKVLCAGKFSSPGVGRDSGRKKSVSKTGVDGVVMGRKSWDDSREVREKGGCKNKVDAKAARFEGSFSRRLSDAKSDNHYNPEETISDAVENTKAMASKSHSGISPSTKPHSSVESSSNSVPQIILHDKKWTDGSISWDSVPVMLSQLGQEAMKKRNIASRAAAEALQEASVSEGVIRGLSMFSDLCATARPENPHPSIDRFFEIYDIVSETMIKAEALSTSRGGDSETIGASDDLIGISNQNAENAFLWIGAALATDLASISLFSKHKFNCCFDSPGDGDSVSEKDQQISKGHDLQESSILSSSSRKSTSASSSGSVLQQGSVDRRRSLSQKTERPGTTLSNGAAKQHSQFSGTPIRNNSTRSTTPKISQGNPMSETLLLAKHLHAEAKKWFLKFVESSLEVGFQLDSVENVQIAVMLSQMKKVNDWLTELSQRKEGKEKDNLEGSIDSLKRKIYNFLLKQVESAACGSTVAN